MTWPHERETSFSICHHAKWGGGSLPLRYKHNTEGNRKFILHLKLIEFLHPKWHLKNLHEFVFVGVYGGSRRKRRRRKSIDLPFHWSRKKAFNLHFPFRHQSIGWNVYVGEKIPCISVCFRMTANRISKASQLSLPAAIQHSKALQQRSVEWM